jgi:two-component system NarL family sensor kinase
LMRRALDASAEERRRIAATLHDGVVQQLICSAFLSSGRVRRPSGLLRAGASASSLRWW